MLLVDVDLGEGDLVRAREPRGELFVDGGDLLAWAAPVGVDCGRESQQIESVLATKISSHVLKQVALMVGQGGGHADSQSVTTIVDDCISSWKCDAEFMWIVLDILK